MTPEGTPAARGSSDGASPVPASGLPSHESARLRGWLLCVTAYVLWGYLAPGGTALLEYYAPLTLNTVRMAAATLLLAPLLGMRRIRAALRILRTDWEVWMLGGVWLGATFGLYSYALYWIPPTIAALLVFFTPFMVGALARPLFGERQGPFFLPAALLTIVAAYATIFGLVAPAKAFGGVTSDYALGLLLAGLSVFGWVGYTLHLRRLGHRYGEATLTLATFGPATLFFLAGALVANVPSPGPFLDTRPFLLMLVYVLLPSVGSYLTYAFAVKALGAGPVSVLIGIELLSTGIVSHFLLNEPFPTHKWLGMVAVGLIVTAYIASETLAKRKPDAMPVAGP